MDRAQRHSAMVDFMQYSKRETVVLEEDHLKVEKENARLREELEALRKDKDRLDWFDRLNRALNEHYGTGYHWKVVVNHNVNKLMLNQDIDMSDWHANGLRTCREAIDAAMSKEAGNG